MFKAAAIALYEARQERQAAKNALVEFRQKHGSCVVDDNGYSCFSHPETKDIPDGNEEYEPWCSTCRESQPLWENYRKSANKAAAALRSLLTLAKKETANEKVRRAGGEQ